MAHVSLIKGKRGKYRSPDEGPEMSLEDEKRASRYVDAIDPTPPSSDRISVAIVKEAIVAIEDFFGVSSIHIPESPDFNRQQYDQLSDNQKFKIGRICSDAYVAWKWINEKKGSKFIIPFSRCLSHNATHDVEGVRERTLYMLEQKGSPAHISVLKGI